MCYTVPTHNGEWADWCREMWYKKTTSVHTSPGLSLSLTIVLVLYTSSALYSMPTFPLERDDAPLPPIINLTVGSTLLFQYQYQYSMNNYASERRVLSSDENHICLRCAYVSSPQIDDAFRCRAQRVPPPLGYVHKKHAPTIPCSSPCAQIRCIG